MSKKYYIRHGIFWDEYLEDENGNKIKLPTPLFGDPYYEIDGKRFYPKKDGQELVEETFFGGGDIYVKKKGFSSEYYEKEESCFLTTACVEYAGLPDDCYELQMMRKFRDEYIRRLPEGAMLIEDYYRTAPVIVERIKSQNDSHDVFQKLLTTLREAVRLIETGCYSEALALCEREFKSFKQRYGCE